MYAICMHLLYLFTKIQTPNKPSLDHITDILDSPIKAHTDNSLLYFFDLPVLITGQITSCQDAAVRRSTS